MQQYNSIKAKYPDALLLFRVGDFYETFGDDAIRCSKILDIVLTKRANGSASHIELAGFPHHALDTYLPKLVRAGLRVAICDQLEDPKLTKTIVKRGVTELVTPGVALNDEVLSSKTNNFLMAVHESENQYGIALLDISTGEFLVSEGNKNHFHKLVQSFRPSEIIYQKRKKLDLPEVKSLFQIEDWAFQLDYAMDKLTQHFKVKSLKGFGIENLRLGTIAAGAVFSYLDETHHFDIQHITQIQRLDENSFVWMDPFTIRNLELIHSPHPDSVTLLNILDKTSSAMGARLLNRWIVMPLKDIEKIKARHEVVDYFLKKDEKRIFLREKISSISDLERMAGKISTGRITPRQLLSLAQSLQTTSEIKENLEKEKSISFLIDQLDDWTKVYTHLLTQLSEDPPHQIGKGNVIAEGISEELDHLRGLQNKGKNYLEELRIRESEKSGIPNLKVSFNNVFGYYIEVRNTHKDKVPQDWIRKQTLVNAERYITAELKEYENQILGAEERILALETNLFSALLEYLSDHLTSIQNSAQILAQLDVLSNFAELAMQNHYVRPKMTDKLDLLIEDGRHPVIEKLLKPGENYIANSVALAPKEQQIIMITGPNMSGKSALLRQTALIVIMAQIGCFVSAKSAEIGIVDKIFTRVGASDNISSGESTFMVEMNETASILNNLSERSLILLDEIGRGTSTYDGISIAWAISEFLHEGKIRPKTLFATHYHELNEMTKSFPRIRNFNVSVKEANDTILFMRKLVAGGSEHSFGIHVAKMAGMPHWVLKRANEVLKTLENSQVNEKIADKTKKITEENMQLSFFQLDDPILESIREELIGLDINTLTPVEALMKLNEIKRKLGK
ncbi:DNA mismatch repair protein MutS [Moheibacter lacus]|uniref:DNA mismatch repair protein MutS n=1 Tax=Moheibacter lacus TaxID=2745851 RepID=A0A838ZJZ8_9FLAO|nr:DNA mismatch repair protein MutS [Moheibacter lacus]MBA5629568.1 DNA mismatch repair protein MutS [Moheibacter lacus]